MSLPFVLTALSRLDGSSEDGIHLLWTAPPAIGYSIDGYDIQRRDARDRSRPTCHELTETELQTLHNNARLDLASAFIRLQLTKCPEFPKTPPNDPLVNSSSVVQPLRLDFQLASPGERSNPHKENGFALLVQDRSGAAISFNQIRSPGVHAGLDCGFQLEITLPQLSSRVELTLVRFAHPPEVKALNAKGNTVAKEVATKAPGQFETLVLSGAAMERIVIHSPQSEALLLKIEVQPEVEKPRNKEAFEGYKIGDLDPADGVASRFDRPAVDFKAAARSGRAAPNVLALARAAIGPVPTHCFFYELQFPASHDIVQVTIGVPMVLAIAMRDNKAVATDFQSAAGGLQEVTFVGKAVDRLLLYVQHAASRLRICINLVQSPADEELEWASAPILAKKIHLPIRNVNHALASLADEETLAASRLFPGETFDGAAFQEVARVMNAAAVDASQVTPVRSTIVTRENTEDPLIELRAWPYAFSLLTNPAWRRMLGFAFFDKKDLTPGSAYDYRVTGRFRRRELEEDFSGFHTIPIGTTLPRRFRLGAVLFETFRPSVVTLFPAPPEDVLEATGLKGIELNAIIPGATSVAITFPSPVRRVILEFLVGDNHSLTFKAKTSDYVFGLSGSTFSGPVPSQRRVVLEFPEVIDTLRLKGSGFLCGIRIPNVASTGNPEDIIQRSVVIQQVRFESTPKPPSPPFIGTVNLQEPQVAGDPAITTQHPPQSMGFRISWLPPPMSPQPAPWPPQLGAFPPFEVVTFDIERRRVDTGEPFQGIEPKSSFFGSRGGRGKPGQLYPGIELLEVFPEIPQPEPPIPVFMEAEDVLNSPARSGPPPSSLHQYRIFSVDAIGRRSSVATVGSVVRLEKRIPPPQPVGPTTPAPAGAIRPSGVQARVLQADDPELPADDRALLGTSANAVVLEWAWTQGERERDPFATEFRVYWQPTPPDFVRGTLVGPAVQAGQFFEMNANLNQPVAVDAFKGRYLLAGAYPFKVAANTAGSAVTIRLERSLLHDTAVPAAGEFEMTMVVAGSALRPISWPERTAVIAISSQENYQFVLRDRFVIDPQHPEVRLWTGVSAADDQSYIPDEIASGQPNGGRPGNESSIAVVVVQARYLGRPVFTVPPPLPDVPEQVTDEPSAGSVTVTLDLITLLSEVTIPTGHRLILDRINAGAILNCMSAQPDDSIGARLPNGAHTTYVLGNPSDQAALLAQIRSSEPARVEGRFVVDFLVRHLAALEPLWQSALATPFTLATVVDTLPDKAERYVHRVRLVDAAGHISSGAAIVPQLVRVVSMRAPATPSVDLSSTISDVLTLSARVHDAFDLRWLVFFSLTTDATAPADSRITEKPQLLRLPNRRDLYPNEGIRLRLRDATLLSPTAVDVSTGTVEVPDRLMSVPLNAGSDKRVSVWAISVTRDGLTSRLAGPSTAFTGPAPIIVPALTVIAGSGIDLASWTPAPPTSQVSIERSVDGGSTWKRVSPLLPETITSFQAPQVTGSRQYRLAVKASQDRFMVGDGVVPS
jgi:hypothetical protein